MRMVDTGPYFAYGLEDAFGLSVAVVYQPELRDFQIAIMVGYLHLAVGIVF